MARPAPLDPSSLVQRLLRAVHLVPTPDPPPPPPTGLQTLLGALWPLSKSSTSSASTAPSPTLLSRFASSWATGATGGETTSTITPSSSSATQALMASLLGHDVDPIVAQYIQVSVLALLAALVLVFVLKPLWVFFKLKPMPPGLKGPSALPIIGVYHHLIPHMNDIFEYVTSLHHKFGDSFAFCGALGYTPCIFTCDVTLVKHVLSDVDTFEKGPDFQDVFRPLLGDGIFNADGKTWRLQRKTASHLFTRRELSTFMTSVFQDHSQVLARSIQGKVDAMQQSGATGDHALIDMAEMYYRFTLDSIGVIAFGEDIGCLASDGKSDFGAAFDRAQEMIDQRFYNPLFLQIERWCGRLSGTVRELNRHLNVLNGFVGDLVRRRVLEEAERRSSQTTTGGRGNAARKERRAGSAPRQDLLSLYLGRAHELGEHFSLSFLRDVVLNFIIAGRDTTACAMQWITYEVARRPDVEQRLLDEIDSVLGNDAPPDFNSVHNKMPYLGAVIDEGLRLYPPVPKNIKHVSRDHHSPIGFLQRGTHVCWFLWIINRRKDVWGEDATLFRPERWLESGFKRPTALENPVFQAGKRTCLGQMMALTEMKICLAVLFRRFRFRLSTNPKHEVRYKSTITLAMRNGLKVKVTPRGERAACLRSMTEMPMVSHGEDDSK